MAGVTNREFWDFRVKTRAQFTKLAEQIANIDTSGGGGISELTSKMVVNALGYTPYNAANPANYITAAALSPYALTSQIPTTLPASDVYAWAKAPTKPSYAWSEITSRPTALSQFTDDVVAGKYLPLNGGTINGTAVQPLYLKNNQSSCGILFFNSTDNATLMYSGGSNWRVTDNGWSNAYYLLHSGNYTDYAKNFADGYNIGQLYHGGTAHTAGWYRIGVTTLSLTQGASFKVSIGRMYNNNPTESFTVEFNAKYGGGSFTQINGVYDNGSHHLDKIRVVKDSSTGLGYIEMHIAVDSKNTYKYKLIGMASAYANATLVTETPAESYVWTTVNGCSGDIVIATKLQTARTLWGQSFDGTNNISGAITLANNQPINVTFTDGTIKNALLLASSNNNLYLGYGTALSGASTFLWGKEIQFIDSRGQPIAIFKDSKLGIGTTSPTERLDVSGNIKASGNINATSITINGVTITASNGSITVNGNVLATGAITAKAVG